ncbi:MAG: hypothetical protein WKG52_10900 [Variovorax sp.]
MTRYVGTVPVDKASHPRFATYRTGDWASHFIAEYGVLPNEGHKAWLIDQVSRILHGTPVVVGQARWTDGRKEDRIWLASPSPRYMQWRKSLRLSEYDEGVPPEA